MTDKLHIKNLEVFAFHGVFPSEKELGQKFLLDIDVTYHMTNAAKNKDLSQSIHYGELCEKITAWMTEKSEDLIETVAYQLIERIFKAYPIAQSVTVHLKKPWAPVHLPLETCSVELTRVKTRAYIGLGTNIGDRHKQLKEAVERLSRQGIDIIKTSDIIETEAWGGVEQDNFLNQVIEIETILDAETLLQTVLDIELEMGRVRDIKWGPRVIDLDILLYGNDVIYQDHLIVPHPYMTEREFVLMPLVQIAPHLIHPVLNRSIRDLKAALDKQ